MRAWASPRSGSGSRSRRSRPSAMDNRSWSESRRELRTAPLAPWLRPPAPAGPEGHFHAAAFSYRPLPRGRVGLRETVASLFESAILQGVLHLLHDPRERIGAGESEFVRGVCWVAPIAAVAGA